MKEGNLDLYVDNFFKGYTAVYQLTLADRKKQLLKENSSITDFDNFRTSKEIPDDARFIESYKNIVEQLTKKFKI